MVVTDTLIELVSAIIEARRYQATSYETTKLNKSVLVTGMELAMVKDSIGLIVTGK